MPPKATAVPKGWPNDVAFLTKFHIPRPINASAVQVKETGRFLAITCAPPIPCPLVKIATISSPSHPAHGQSGLFAARALPPDSFILFYLGHVHDSSTSNVASNYDLSLDRELDLSVDATKHGNEARFINDYRGVRTEGPNAEFRDCVLQIGHGTWERRIGVFVLSKGKNDKGPRAQGIKKGDEILVSYGKGFWDARRTEAATTMNGNESFT